MRIEPAIAVLRTDRRQQARAQAAMFAAGDRWRTEVDAAATLLDLKRFGAGAPLEACPALETLFTKGAPAPELAARLVGHFADALMAEPFGHPPYRHAFDGAVATLVLAREGRAQLILQSREPGETVPTFVRFSDAVRFEAVLAGEAEARIVRPTTGPAAADRPFHAEALALSAGSRLALDCGTEALQVLSTRRRLVVLRLYRAAADPQPSRQHDLASGALKHQAAGSARSSRQETMLALLGRMQVAEAAPLMAEMSLEEGDPSLRWQALRECLALDTATGFAALLAVARREGDPLAPTAGALRAQLVETYPQLHALETA